MLGVCLQGFPGDGYEGCCTQQGQDQACPSLLFLVLSAAQVDPRRRWYLIASIFQKDASVWGKSCDSLYPRLAEAPPPGLKFPEEPIHSVPSILCEASMAFAWVHLLG